MTNGRSTGCTSSVICLVYESRRHMQDVMPLQQHDIVVHGEDGPRHPGAMRARVDPPAVLDGRDGRRRDANLQLRIEIAARSSERQGRLIDHDETGSMEKKKREGYF